MKFDYEDWLINVGHEVIEKETESGKKALSPIERLIYCLWVADYGMRNAGDLETARDLDETFQQEGAKLATKLKLAFTRESLLLPSETLEKQYFERFDRICEEIKSAMS